jgi:hypothetical protein
MASPEALVRSWKPACRLPLKLPETRKWKWKHRTARSQRGQPAAASGTGKFPGNFIYIALRIMRGAPRVSLVAAVGCV